jgi:hypothetical protein
MRFYQQYDVERWRSMYDLKNLLVSFLNLHSHNERAALNHVKSEEFLVHIKYPQEDLRTRIYNGTSKKLAPLFGIYYDIFSV